MNEAAYREAVLADCEAIARLKGAVWNTTYRGIYSDEALDNYDVRKNEEVFRGIVTNPDVSLHVAEEAGKIVGFMSCGRPFRPFRDYEQDIGLLYVLKSHQGRGIGKRLFNIGRDRIAYNGFDRFFISVNKYNDRALKFYIAMGGTIFRIDDDNMDRRNVQIKLHYTL